MKPYYKHACIARAKELRKNATRQENHLWYDYLRTYPVRFQRQRPILGFIADFYCAAAKLVIELDGSQHYTDEGKAYDTERTLLLEREGLFVLRFANNDVDSHFESVCFTIDQEVQKRMAHYDQL